jgi:DNA replication protein DnaC
MVEAKKIGSALGREELPEREYDCPKHGKYRGIPVRLSFLNMHKDVIDPMCPKCIEEEKASVEEEKRRQREEENERQRIKWLTDLNIGKRNWESTFENFDAYTPELKRHLAICQEFAKDPQGRKLVMLGNNGTGKNHLATSVLKITGGILYTIFEIELMLRQSYSGETQEYRIIQELCSTEMLVIDEIGRTKGGKWEEDWLSHVIDKRHKNFMPLILISNCHLRENCPDGGGCPKCIQNYLENDVISRIIEDGIVLNFAGEDYRKRIREKRKETRK